MIKVAMINMFGIPEQIITPSSDDMYEDGSMYGDMTAIHIPFDSVDEDYFNLKYYKDGAWHDKPTQPTQFHDFDITTESWVANVPRAKKWLRSQIKTKYENVKNGLDPNGDSLDENIGSIYVDCTVGQQTFRMATGWNAAVEFETMVRLHERIGAATLPIVRDFNDTNYLDVPLAGAAKVCELVLQDALKYWEEFVGMMDAVRDANTLGQLQAINTDFSVNIG